MGRTVAYALAVAVVAALAGSLLWVRYGPVQAEAIWAAYASAPGGGAVRIVYPLDGTLFPPEIVAPTFRWEDESTDATVWLVRVQFDGGTPPIQSLSCWRQWTPTPQDWELIKKSSVHREARVLVIGVKPGWSRKIVSAGAIVLRTASDEVGAPPCSTGK